jgi:GDP-fucose transporter C1
VVIKKALDVVKGSAMDLSWYTNLLSAGVLVPLVLVMGELPEIKKLFFPPEQAVVVPDARLGLLGTFLWGSLISVSLIYGLISVQRLMPGYRACLAS